MQSSTYLSLASRMFQTVHTSFGFSPCLPMVLFLSQCNPFLYRIYSNLPSLGLRPQSSGHQTTWKWTAARPNVLIPHLHATVGSLLQFCVNVVNQVVTRRPRRSGIMNCSDDIKACERKCATSASRVCVAETTPKHGAAVTLIVVAELYMNDKQRLYRQETVGASDLLWYPPAYRMLTSGLVPQTLLAKRLPCRAFEQLNHKHTTYEAYKICRIQSHD